MYSTCIECFIKKVRCEFCNKELNKSYLRSHIKKQHLQSYAQSYAQGYTQGHGQGSAHSQSYAQGYTQGYGQGSAQSYAQGLHYEQSIDIKDSFKCATKDAAEVIAKTIANGAPNDDDKDVLQHYSTLMVGPSFCGKTHFLLNKLQLIRLCDSGKQVHIIPRSPEQYEDVGSKMKLDVGDLGLVVEEDLGDKSIQDFQNCCVVFEEMLDSNQNLIDPFFY